MNLLISSALFIIIYVCLLYTAVRFFNQKFHHDRVKKKLVALWLWRLMIVSVIVYVTALLMLNRTAFMLLSGNFMFMASLWVFYASLIQIVIIDILLPVDVTILRRFIIQTVIFTILTGITYAIIHMHIYKLPLI